MGTTRELTKEQQDAINRETERAYTLLNPDKSRRLGQETDRPVDTRTKEQRLEDKAMVQSALVVKREQTRTLESVKSEVIKSIGSKLGMNDVQVEVYAGMAFQNGLDPNPVSGHMYAWVDYKKVKQGNNWVTEKYLVMAFGYQGYIYKARQQFNFEFLQTREMTKEERELHDLEEGDKGAVVSIVDFDAAAKFKAVGMTPVPMEAVGIWRKKAKLNKKTSEWMEDNIPNTWSAFQVAEKRAITKVLKLKGIKFNNTLPDVEGLRFDPDTNSFVMPAPNAPDPDDDDVIDGDFDFDDSPTEPEKVEAAPVVKRNGKHGDGKPSYTKIEEPEAVIENGAELADILEADDPIEVVEDVEDLPTMSMDQVGRLRYLARKASNNDEKKMEALEVEICSEYEIAGGFENMPNVHFAAIEKGLTGKQDKPKTQKPKAVADRPRTKDDVNIDPDEYQELYEAVKVHLNGAGTLEGLEADDLDQKVKRTMATWSGCTALTSMTKAQAGKIRGKLEYAAKKASE